MSLTMALSEKALQWLTTIIPLIIPVISGAWKLIIQINDRRKNQLDEIYKKFKDNLDSENKKLIAKELNKRIRTQLTGVMSPVASKRYVFILNRSDIHLGKYLSSQLCKFLTFNGNRFFFDFRGKYYRLLIITKFVALIYFSYSLIPFYILLKGNHLNYSIGALVFITTFCFIVGLLMWHFLPSIKKIQNINGKMLKIDGGKYQD